MWTRRSMNASQGPWNEEKGEMPTWTLVEHVGLCNITSGEPNPLSYLHHFAPDGQDGVQGCASGEGVPRVVHDALVVVVQAQGVDLLVRQLVEVVLLAWGGDETLFSAENLLKETNDQHFEHYSVLKSKTGDTYPHRRKG